MCSLILNHVSETGNDIDLNILNHVQVPIKQSIFWSSKHKLDLYKYLLFHKYFWCCFVHKCLTKIFEFSHVGSDGFDIYTSKVAYIRTLKTIT